MPYKIIKKEKRYFEKIVSDVFKEKIGEVIFKKFADQKFGRDITLDWSISREIESFKSDIVDSRKVISIKSTDTLESIWAEAPKNTDYGIFIKVSLPKDFLMKMLAFISSLEKLLKYVQDKIKEDITASDTMDLVGFIKETVYGEQMAIKAFTCGFFKTSNQTFKHKEDRLFYIGGEFELYEDKHIVKCTELKRSDQDWREFLREIF